jgi:hypothetical protein
MFREFDFSQEFKSVTGDCNAAQCYLLRGSRLHAVAKIRV